MTTYPSTQLNGSNSTVKNNSPLFTPARLVTHKRTGEEFRSGDAAMDSTDHCSSGLRTLKSRKRFKPDLVGTKHRPAHNTPAEDFTGEGQVRTPAKQAAIPIPIPIASPALTTVSTEGGESHEGTQEGSGGVGEEEGEDDDGANHQQQLLQQKKIQGPEKAYAGTPTIVPISVPTGSIVIESPSEFLLEPEGVSASGTADVSSSGEGSRPEIRSISESKSKLKAKIEKKKSAARQKIRAEDAEKAAVRLGFCLVARKEKGLIFRCPEQHKVVFKKGQEAKDLACGKCAKKYKKCLEHAKAHNGRIKDDCYHATVTFECQNGHEWKLKYCKYMFSRWCPQCEKLKREDKKRALEEMEQKIREETAAQQEAKLEEARLKMLEEERLKYVSYQSWFYQWPASLYSPEYQQAYMTDESINELARELAVKYVAESCSPEVEDIFFMHKVLMTSSQMLVAKMMLIPKEECASFYRKHAVRLHPDKNHHPRSNEAFQKFTECYKYCAQFNAANKSA